MKRVIIESPFSSGTTPSLPIVVERNIRYVRATMRDCLIKGEAPFASHAFYTLPGVLDDTNPIERKIGMEAGFAWMRSLGVDGVRIYKDLGMSSGMLVGMDNAKSWGRPIEERLLGGEWALCSSVHCDQNSTTPGPFHAYACPLWRNS